MTRSSNSLVSSDSREYRRGVTSHYYSTSVHYWNRLHMKLTQTLPHAENVSNVILKAEKKRKKETLGQFRLSVESCNGG